ncbi:MAG: hypothetical protein IV100_19085 [Myxococcales bacterium]|nr:hypothetical protein [Myxococcales bacterium]
MKFLHVIQIGKTEKGSFGERVRAVTAALGAPDEFMCGGAQTKIAKTIPGLASCALPPGSMANLGPFWRAGRADPPPLDPADITTLADGVPKPYSCDRAFVTWRNHPLIRPRAPFSVREPAWNQDNVSAPPLCGDDPAPMVIVIYDYKKVSVFAFVEAVADADTKELPPPAAVMDLLRPIGVLNVLGHDVNNGPTDYDRIRATSGAAFNLPVLQRDSLLALAQDLPHALPEAPVGGTLQALTSPHAVALKAATKSLGYTPHKGSSSVGKTLLSKYTARGNRLVLDVDFGTMSRRVHAHLRIFGVDWRRSLTLHFTGRDLDNHAYPIVSDAEFQRVVDNIAALLPRVEATVLPELEALYPPTPAWWHPLPSQR